MLGILVRAITPHRTLQVGDQVCVLHVENHTTVFNFVFQNPTPVSEVRPLPLALGLAHLRHTFNAQPPGPLLPARRCVPDRQCTTCACEAQVGLEKKAALAPTDGAPQALH